MKKSQVNILHLVFWLIVTAINFSFLIFRKTPLPAPYYISFGVKLLLQAGTFYFVYSFLMPYALKDKRYFLMSGLTILYILIYVPFYALALTAVDILVQLEENWDNLRALIVPGFYYTIFYVLLGGLFRLAIEGFHNQQQKIQLEKLHVKNELALLRSQINPHFLFNSLNTIHSYILSQNPNSAQAVIRLSDIMRYMLYDAGKEKITLSQELEYLKSYISLQDFRFEKKGLVKFNIDGDPSGIDIPPMLLTPFVENAFKHGRISEDQAGILMNLHINESQLTFDIRNQVNPNSKVKVEKGDGLGLVNVRRRLDLLFPGKYSLQIFENTTEFTVKLELKLQ